MPFDSLGVPWQKIPAPGSQACLTLECAQLFNWAADGELWKVATAAERGTRKMRRKIEVVMAAMLCAACSKAGSVLRTSRNNAGFPIFPLKLLSKGNSH